MSKAEQPAQAEAQQPSDGLVDHFPTGLRSTFGYLPQTGEVFESPIQCECHCGAAFTGTDEQEVRQQWAEHAALKARTSPETVELLREARNGIVMGWRCTKNAGRGTVELVARIDAHISNTPGKESSDG